MKLVIIAAGLGSRLASVSKGIPKLLVPILGIPLIEKLLSNCIDAEIHNIVVVTGYNNYIIEEYLNNLSTPIKIDISYNPEWELANGVSVLAAKKYISQNEEFMISMSDHFYNSELLKLIKAQNIDHLIASVGADYKINEIHDLNDGMKLHIDENSHLINAMSKNLKIYNAIDCGIFKCKYSFFDYLIKAKQQGNCSLSDACNLLITERLMGSVDIKNYPWIDVDTPEALLFIEQNPEKYT